MKNWHLAVALVVLAVLIVIVQGNVRHLKKKMQVQHIEIQALKERNRWNPHGFISGKQHKRWHEREAAGDAAGDKGE